MATLETKAALVQCANPACKVTLDEATQKIEYRFGQPYCEYCADEVALPARPVTPADQFLGDVYAMFGITPAMRQHWAEQRARNEEAE